MSLSNQTGSTHDCETIQNLIPEYAFGLTSPEDTLLVEAGLADCPDAAAELSDYRRIQEELRDSTPEIEPPVALGERLMAAIAEPKIQSTSRERPNRIAWGMAAAALIALVLTNIYWLGRVDRLNQEQNNQQVVQTNPEGNSAFILTGTSDLRWVRLPPSQQDTDASAFLMWNAESEIGLLYVRGFPELVTGKTYQLWFNRGELRVSAGTFEVDEEGTGALLFHVSEPIDEYVWARITEEPESGSIQPTGMVVVVGEL